MPLINNGQAPGGPGPLCIYLVPGGPIDIGPRFDLNFHENQLTSKLTSKFDEFIIGFVC